MARNNFNRITSKQLCIGALTAYLEEEANADISDQEAERVAEGIINIVKSFNL